MLKHQIMVWRRFAVAACLLPCLARGEPAHQDRTKPPDCTDATVIADMRRILVHAFEPYHIDVLDILHTEDGEYEGDQVCAGVVMTTKGPMRVVFFGQKVEGRIYGRVLTLQ